MHLQPVFYFANNVHVKYFVEWCVFFQKYVDYYQVIPEPIDLRIIAQKIQSQSYQTLDDMYKDLMLMIHNAKFFNKPSSLIYKVCQQCDFR